MKIDLVAVIQDTNTLCVLPPVWMADDCCVSGVVTGGDLVDQELYCV